MSEQPTALRLADWLDVRACGGDNWNAKMNAAAAELRRLHAENEKLRQQPAFGALVAISLLTHLGGEVAEYADVVEAVRRLHSVNTELGAALRRLISYCNTLENRLMEADGEHPAVQEAKEAWAKVEGKV